MEKAETIEDKAIRIKEEENKIYRIKHLKIFTENTRKISKKINEKIFENFIVRQTKNLDKYICIFYLFDIEQENKNKDYLKKDLEKNLGKKVETININDAGIEVTDHENRKIVLRETTGCLVIHLEGEDIEQLAEKIKNIIF